MNDLTSTKPITNLGINNEIIAKLTIHNIITIKDLWQLKRNDLKKLA